MAKLNQQLHNAQRNGNLTFVNQEYRARRLAARERGEPFPPYRAVEARLRKAIVGVAAGEAPALARRAFDPIGITSVCAAIYDCARPGPKQVRGLRISKSTRPRGHFDI